MTDPIADMIIRIKNAVLSRHQTVAMPHSKMKEALANLLVESGYIDSVDIVKQSPRDEMVIKIKYVGRVPAITNVRRISKPGRRMYSSVMKIPRSLGGYGLTIVSTNKGIMSDKQARQQNVGGEVICQIW